VRHHRAPDAGGATSNMSILSKADHEAYFRDGYLIIDPRIPAQVIDGVLADLDGKYPDPLNGAGVQPPTRIQDAWKTSHNVRSVAVWPHILDVLRELYGREALPFQTLNFPVGTLQKPHSDIIHFNTCPSGFMCGVWVALEDTNEMNGAVRYYVGSHRLPEYTPADVGCEPTDAGYIEYEKYIAKVIKDFDLKGHVASMKKGQALIWASNLIHEGSERRDLYRSRHSQVTHVYFEGCKYWTPLYSKGTKVYWRNPQWIPKDLSVKLDNVGQPFVQPQSLYGAKRT
jgi:hypothetical protein